MALTNIVSMEGDALSAITLPIVNGTVNSILSEKDGMGSVGQASQGTPSHIGNEGGPAMLSLPSLQGYPRSRVVNA